MAPKNVSNGFGARLGYFRVNLLHNEWKHKGLIHAIQDHTTIFAFRVSKRNDFIRERSHRAYFIQLPVGDILPVDIPRAANHSYQRCGDC